ncbi:MAG: nucleotidyltransferase family protein [Candidatus Melainabacteria bacterium]|nr:nucleotidyltransferase family protein [Candidatus Melainabacteria bacterium]
MDLAELIVEKREQILAVAAKRGARDVRVFGSVARGDYDNESDVDFLVELEPGRSLFDLSGLICDLEELLGVKVDVGTYRMLKRRNREEILKEAIAL